VAVDVGELLAQAGLGRDAQTLLLQPVSECGDEGTRKVIVYEIWRYFSSTISISFDFQF
jgi:hypothetical protein